jgi:hypothetical protein
MEIATSLGIGLIKLRSQNVQGVQEYLSAPLAAPRPRFVLQVLENIGLSSCTLCRGLFKGTYKQGVKRADRENVNLMIRRAINLTTDEGNPSPTGFLFWSERAVNMKRAAGDSASNTARRYVCPDCLVNIVGPLLEDQSQVKKTNEVRISVTE